MKEVRASKLAGPRGEHVGKYAAIDENENALFDVRAIKCLGNILLSIELGLLTKDCTKRHVQRCPICPKDYRHPLIQQPVFSQHHALRLS